jgi:hypothetical protein
VKRHLTFANVASALALFFAIGGGTAAIALQGKNRVDSGDIKNRAVKTRDLANNAATGAKVNESTFTIVPDSDELDGISSELFQIGNGVAAAIAGGVDDTASFGRIDLGSVTLRLDCVDSNSMTVAVTDEAGGASPSASVPTDVWVNGAHDQITTDGSTTLPESLDLSTGGSALRVQVWTTDDVVTDANVSAFYNTQPANDVCTVVVPIQQNFVAASPVNGASAQPERPPMPTASGLLPRG